MTLTEFNRSPSRATKAVAQGEDVVLTRHGGEDMLLTRLHKPLDPIEQGIAEGWITPPKAGPGPIKWPDLNLSPEEAAEAIAWFEDSRKDRY